MRSGPVVDIGHGLEAGDQDFPRPYRARRIIPDAQVMPGAVAGGRKAALLVPVKANEDEEIPRRRRAPTRGACPAPGAESHQRWLG
jgi:hypothetical protein